MRINEKKRAKNLAKGYKVVVIGGGTGLATMLRGLKNQTSNVTAVVTVADDGGGSGILRKDMGILPPGDIRNCILALAEAEPIMQQLLNYRFTEGMLKGQSFGNLFLAAMNGISGDFLQAVKRVSDVLAVKGRVLPVSDSKIVLYALMDDDNIVVGESNIGNRDSGDRSRINKVFLDPPHVEAVDEVIDAILDADGIVLGPGSVYTSIIPNLLVNGVVDAIEKSNAVKIYICNVMTQPGETDAFSVYDHIWAIEKHSRTNIMDYCIANTQHIPGHIRLKYYKEGSELVRVDYQRLKLLDTKMIYKDLISIKNDLVRHNEEKLAETIIALIYEKSRTKKRGDLFNVFKRNNS